MSLESLRDAASALREASASLDAVLAACDSARSWGGTQSAAIGGGEMSNAPGLLPSDLRGLVGDEPLSGEHETAGHAAVAAARAAASKLRTASIGLGPAAEAAADAAEASAEALEHDLLGSRQ